MLTRALLTVAAILLMARVATAADIKTTVDPTADLGKYRTFTFMQADPKDKGAITDTLAHERLRRMIEIHLGKRGYKPVEPGKADLGVHFTDHVELKQRVLMTGTPGPYSHGWGRTELGGQDTFNYREGTLTVDLIDVSSNQLLWRTRISEALTASYSEENWKKIDQALGEAFKKVPSQR